MNDRGRLQKGDRVSRICAHQGGSHPQLKVGVIVHTGSTNVQVQWEDGTRRRYSQSELTYVPEEKKP